MNVYGAHLVGIALNKRDYLQINAISSVITSSGFCLSVNKNALLKKVI